MDGRTATRPVELKAGTAPWNRVAVVTGAASGIGQAISEALAHDGWQVIVADINEENGRATAASLGGAAEFHRLDVMSGDSVKTLADYVIGKYGGAYLLVNVAGGATPLAFMETDEAQWSRIVDWNLLSVFRCSHAFLQPMLDNFGGRIISVSSSAGLSGQPLQAAYSAAKGGVIALTKVLAKEFVEYGVTVNAIAPGMVITSSYHEWKKTPEGSAWIEAATAKLPMGRLSEAFEQAAMVAFLARPEAAYITGQAISISGGSWM